MNTPNEPATVDKLADLIYGSGFCAVHGCFTVSKDYFIHIANFSIENDVDGFAQYQFIAGLGLDMEGFYKGRSVILDQDYVEKVRSYANCEMAISPIDPSEYNEYADDITKRLDMLNSYESRRMAANSFLASKKNRKRILNAHSNVCALCGSVEDLSIDHIVSVVKGGGNEDNNLQVLCRSCNSSKGAK